MLSQFLRFLFSRLAKSACFAKAVPDCPVGNDVGAINVCPPKAETGSTGKPAFHFPHRFAHTVISQAGERTRLLEAECLELSNPATQQQR